MSYLSYLATFVVWQVFGLLTFAPVSLEIMRSARMHEFQLHPFGTLLAVCGLLFASLFGAGAIALFSCNIITFAVVVFVSHAVVPPIILIVVLGEVVYMRHLLWWRKM